MPSPFKRLLKAVPQPVPGVGQKTGALEYGFANVSVVARVAGPVITEASPCHNAHRTVEYQIWQYAWKRRHLPSQQQTSASSLPAIHREVKISGRGAQGPVAKHRRQVETLQRGLRPAYWEHVPSSQQRCAATTTGRSAAPNQRLETYAPPAAELALIRNQYRKYQAFTTVQAVVNTTRQRRQQIHARNVAAHRPRWRWRRFKRTICALRMGGHLKLSTDDQHRGNNLNGTFKYDANHVKLNEAERLANHGNIWISMLSKV